MGTQRISNLYALLHIEHTADTPTIAAAIAQQRQLNQIKTPILGKAEEWLLNPAMRERYDAQLHRQYPELFQQAAQEWLWSNTDAPPSLQAAAMVSAHTEKPSTSAIELALEAPVPSSTRLGLLEPTGHRDVKIEPALPLDTIAYVHEHKRYDKMTKWVIYGGMVLLLLGVMALFAWPLLKKTVLAPSEWDKHAFRQEWVQKGWQEDSDAGYVYLPSQQYTSRLAIVFRDNDAMPVLTETGCDTDKKGLCRISVRIDDAWFANKDEIGVGLLDDLPLASRAHRADMVKRLQDAHKVEVSYVSGGQQINQTFLNR